jgi:hypothetical protein
MTGKPTRTGGGCAGARPIETARPRDARMTLDVYAHVLAGQDENAVAKLEAYERVAIA